MAEDRISCVAGFDEKASWQALVETDCYSETVITVKTPSTADIQWTNWGEKQLNYYLLSGYF